MAPPPNPKYKAAGILLASNAAKDAKDALEKVGFSEEDANDKSKQRCVQRHAKKRRDQATPGPKPTQHEGDDAVIDDRKPAAKPSSSSSGKSSSSKSSKKAPFQHVSPKRAASDSNVAKVSTVIQRLYSGRTDIL